MPVPGSAAGVFVSRPATIAGVELWSVQGMQGSPKLLSPGFFIAAATPECRDRVRTEVFTRGRCIGYAGVTLELHGPGEVFQVVRTSKVDSGVLVLQPDCLAGLLPETDTRGLTFEAIRADDPAAVGQFWRAFRRLRGPLGDALDTEAPLVALIHALGEHVFGKSGRARDEALCPRRVLLVKELIQDRYAERVGLDDIARAVGLSKYHLHRMFKRAVGVPIDGYRRLVRMDRALALLRGGLPPAAVAAEVGFVDQAHLTKQMQAQLGFTPGHYHRAIRYKTVPESLDYS